MTWEDPHPCPWTRRVLEYLADTASDTQVLTLAVGAAEDVSAVAKAAGSRLLDARARLEKVARAAYTQHPGDDPPEGDGL